MSEKNFTNATGNWIVSNTGEISYVGTVKVNGELRAAKSDAGECAFAAGKYAGDTNQGGFSVAIGNQASSQNQGEHAVAIGHQAARNNQSQESVAVGSGAGRTDQGRRALSIGYEAGYENQQSYATAVGPVAGNTNQGQGAVGVGYAAGLASQGAHAVAIGYQAGEVDQGEKSVAIGYQAGKEQDGNALKGIGKGSIHIKGGMNAVNLMPDTDDAMVFNTKTGSLVYNGGDEWEFKGGEVKLQGLQASMNIHGGENAYIDGFVQATDYLDANGDSIIGSGGDPVLKDASNRVNNSFKIDNSDNSFVVSQAKIKASILELPGPTSQNISSKLIFGNWSVGEKWDSNTRPNDRLLAFRSGNVDMFTLNNGNDSVFLNKGKLWISRMSIQKASSDDGFSEDSLGIMWDNNKKVNIDWKGNAKFEGEVRAQDFIDRYGKKLAVSRVLPGMDNGITEFWTMTQTEYDARGHSPTAMYFITE